MLLFFRVILFALASLFLCSFQSKPFIVGKLKGQLGNQLFQVATVVSLALDNNARPIFPDFLLPSDPVFKLPLYYQNVFYRLDASNPPKSIEYAYFDESNFIYHPIPYRPNMSVEGWFQSEKFFLAHKTEVLELFEPNDEILTYLHNHYGDIIDHPKTVSIHYRSYKKEDPNHKVYLNQTMEYYNTAMELFPDDDYLFVVFSNDMEWCKKNFGSLSRQIIFIEGQILGKADYLDLYLMSMCKNNIICNSSFSWWGAYLNKYSDKIVVCSRRMV